MSIALIVCHGDYSVFSKDSYYVFFLFLESSDYVGQILNVTIPDTLCLRERVK